MTAPKGLPFIGKMGLFLDRALHATIQKIGQSRAGLDVIGMGYYILNGGAPYTVEAGSDDNLVKVTAHGFKPGDLVRLSTTANPIKEFEIIIHEIVDANTFTLAGYLSASLTTGDLFYCLRPISQQFSSTGVTLATLSTSPIQYNRKTGGVTTAVNVIEDLDTPTNSRALPVVLHGLDAAVVTVTANEINIRSDSTNDSMSIGNTAGTFQADVTAIGLKVDGTGFTQPVSGTFWQATQPVSGTVTANAGTNLNTSALALETTQAANGVLIGSVTETAPVSDTASSGLNGRLQRIAQRLTSLIALLPTALGQGTMATSLKVVLPSDQSAIPVSQSGTWNITNVSGTVSLPTGAATSANQTTELAQLGIVTETAPVSDTASSGLNGRLQRIAQNITTMSAKLPAALGITTAAGSLSIAPASDAVFTMKNKAITTSYTENLNLTTVATLTAPANAIGVTLMADDTNANNIRIKQGGSAASVTSGFPLQAGRDLKLDCGTDVSVISDNAGVAGASVKIYAQWLIQA